MRPKVSFETPNIWTRLETCKSVAEAYGWHPNDIIHFTEEVQTAFTYEEAMAIIVSILVLVAGFMAVARVERVLAAPALILVTIPSDPRSPPRA